MPGRVEPDDGVAGGSEGPHQNQQATGVAEAQVTMDELPPGWTKETKYRKTGNSGKKDTNYIDPKRKYVFSSLKDVSRYLENGDITCCRSRTRRITIDDVPGIEEDHVQATEGKEELLGEAVKEKKLSKEKIMTKANTEGASKGSEHDRKLTPDSKGPSRLVEVTSVNETPPRCSSQHVKKEVKGNNLSGKSYKQKQEKVDTETKGFCSTSPEDSAVKTDIIELMHPKKHGKRSARLMEKNATPCVPLEVLLNSEKELIKHGHDQNVGSKKMKSTQGGNTSCSASKRVLKLKENRSEDTNAELPALKLDIVERIDPKKRGKSTVRARGKKPASWVSQDGLQNSEKELSKQVNEEKVGSMKIKTTHGGATSCHTSKRVSKVKENSGAHNDVSEQINIPMIDTLAEVKESIGAHPNKWAGVMIDTLAEVKEGNGGDANATEQTGVLIPDTLFEVMGSNHSDANAAEKMDASMTDTIAELKVRNDADANFVVQTGAPTTNTLADLKESKIAVANALEQTTVQKIDAVDPQQGKANNDEAGPAIFPGLDLDIGAENFDLSSAESALTSLYGESEWDSCIEFAVKLLMDQTPLPTEAADVEEFFSQNMNSEKIANAGPSESLKSWKPLNRKNRKTK